MSGDHFVISEADARNFSNVFDLERTLPRELAADEEDLRELVSVAVWTPLLAAHDALHVLCDVLLERGKIHDHVETPVDFTDGEERWTGTFREPAPVLEQAMAWARAKHLPPLQYDLRSIVPPWLRPDRESVSQAVYRRLYRRLTTPRHEEAPDYGVDLRPFFISRLR